MGRKSSITRLPPEVKEAVDRAIREGRASAAEIVALVDQLGERVSESAVTRYARSARAKMEDYLDAQQIASVWIKKAEEDPSGDVARLNHQLLSTAAFKVLSEIEKEDLDPQKLMLLGKALDHLAKAERNSLERELRIRKEVAEQATKIATRAGKKNGLSVEVVDEIRREILGLAA